MTYAELVTRPIEEVRVLFAASPDVPAIGNALRELERMAKNAKKLARQGRNSAQVRGMTKNRFAHKGSRRCPTLKELR